MYSDSTEGNENEIENENENENEIEIEIEIEIENENENENDAQSSFRSTPTPPRKAKKEVKKIKRVLAEQQIERDTNQNDELRSRIQAKIREHKPKHPRSNTNDSESENKPPNEFPTAPAIAIALAEDLETMELETEQLLEDLERAKKERKRQQAAKEGVDEEFLAGRITELEVENKILQTRLQSGQATVDSIRADITSMASSNEDRKKALQDAKAAARPLQLEQETLRAKLLEAHSDLQSLKHKADLKRTTRSVETNQIEVFEQAIREILDLQKNHRLKRQISQRKLQQKQLRQKQQETKQHIKQQLQQHIQTQKQKQPLQRQPLQRSMQRQNSWWQLDTPEQAPKKKVRSKSYQMDMEAIHRIATEDSDIDTTTDE